MSRVAIVTPDFVPAAGKDRKGKINGGILPEAAGGSMSRGPASFRQSDLKRAIKALKAAGEHITGVRFDSAGKPVIITGKGESATSASNPWDEAVAKLAA